MAHREIEQDGSIDAAACYGPDGFGDALLETGLVRWQLDPDMLF